MAAGLHHLVHRGVHKGFEDGATAAWKDLVNAARSATGGVYLTGHSLGAALAVVAASRLVEHNIIPADRILGVYTIGMPRIGDASYTHAYDARLGMQTFRLIYGEDLATKVPPSVLLGYRHVGRWLASPRNGAFAGAPTNAPPPDDDVLSLAALLVQGRDNTAPGFPTENPLAVEAAALLPGTLRDHLTDGYLRALRGLT